MPDDLFVPPDLALLLDGAAPRALARVDRGLTAALGETWFVRTAGGLIVATRDSRMKPLERLELDPARPPNVTGDEIVVVTDDGRAHRLPLPFFGADEVRALLDPGVTRPEAAASAVPSPPASAVRPPPATRDDTALPAAPAAARSQPAERNAPPPAPAPAPPVGRAQRRPPVALLFVVTLAALSAFADTDTIRLVGGALPLGVGALVLGVIAYLKLTPDRPAAAPPAPLEGGGDADEDDADEDDADAIDEASLYGRAYVGDADGARALLDAGAPVAERFRHGETALHAAATGETEVLQLLLDRGADPNARAEDGTTPLHVAADMGDAETIALLVRWGAEVDARDARGRTPLHHAAWTDPALIRALLAQGAALEARDADGYTPLHVAAGFGAEEDVRALLEAGADRHARVPDGRTPAELAFRPENRAALAERS